MSLYDINAELSELLDRGFMVDEETGELIEDITERLTELQMAEQDKLENIALYIKNLGAESAAIKAEEKALADRRKAKEKRQESLKKYLADYLQNTERSKFETPKVRVSFRKSEKVEYSTKFIEWAFGEKRFLRHKDPDIDRAALKKAIRNGEEIPGATLIERQNLQIK